MAKATNWQWSIIDDAPTTTASFTLSLQQTILIASALSSMDNPESWDVEEIVFYDEINPLLASIILSFGDSP